MSMKMKSSPLGPALLAAVFIVAGCNGTEDFSGANLNSPVLGGDGAPEDPAGPAVEVELIAGLDAAEPRSAAISNLGYSCGDFSSYIPKEANLEGFTPHLARCPLTARTIDFFIGDVDDAVSRVSLGTAHLPQLAGRGSPGGTGYFQFALGDLIDGPGRVASTEASVSYRAALLAALDSNAATSTVIEVPDAAHAVVIGGTPAPDPLFDTSLSYEDFKTAWDGWLDTVKVQAGNPGLEFPVAEADAQAFARAGALRTQSGEWLLDHNGQSTLTYAVRFQDDENYRRLSLSVGLLVFPDGLVRGVGVARTLPTESQPESGVDFVNIEAGASSVVDESLYFGGAPGEAWEVSGVLESPTIDLLVSGKMFNSAAFDGIPYDLSEEESIVDYELDYPEREAAADIDNANPDSTDVTRIEGSLFGQALPSVGAFMTRVGIVGSVIDEAVLGTVPDFYRLTMKMACFKDTQDPACTEAIPAEEIGLNFPASLGDYVIDNEKPREWRDGDEGHVYLQILDNGMIVSDRDGDCSPVDPVTLLDGAGGVGPGGGNSIQEYKVGFITRTNAEAESANMSVLLAGSAAWADPLDVAHLPQFGTLVSGRMNLADVTVPLYRLSDENFEDEVRAGWLDSYQPLVKQAEYASEESLTLEQQREIVALSKGAIEGVALDSGTCTPIPPAP